MRITVLGRYGPYPPAGGTCSGYLLEKDGCYVLLDCGSGVISKLQHFIKLKSLSAVILSHLHKDHVSDIPILGYAWQAAMSEDPKLKPLTVYAPGLPEEEFSRLAYKDVFKLEAIEEGDVGIKVGPFKFSFSPTRHAVPTYAVSAEVEEEEKFVYTGDTAHFPGLADLSKGASLLLCEANYLEDELEQGEVYHMSARQAASLALNAGVGELLLTHLPPHREPILFFEEAERVFKRVRLAEEGHTYDCGSFVESDLGEINNEEGETEETVFAEDWVMLVAESSPIKLSLIEGRLKFEGIPVMISGAALGWLYGQSTWPMAERKIFVPSHCLAEAKDLLQSIQGLEVEDFDFESDDYDDE